MYLREDITGASSLTEYGKRGDKVEVISGSMDMILVQGLKHKFHVRAEKLSEQPITGEPIEEVEQVKEEKPIAWLPEKEIPTITEIKADKKGQTSLF